ncbi:2-oxoglutarate and iron-dependent oxygenase domain-containing protein [soil metagenome]
MRAIGVLDLSPAPGSDAESGLVEAVRSACEEVGFFQVVGHGIDPALFDAAHAAYEALFALPGEVKQRWVTSSPFRGYRRPGSTFVQVYGIANLAGAAEARARGTPEELLDFFEPFPWPEVDGFRAATTALMAAERTVAARLMSLIARSIGLPADHFVPAFEHDVCDLTGRQYLGGGPDPVVLGEHTDSGALTLLHQRGTYDGLLVRALDGELLAVPTREDALVVNLGQLVERWTDGRYRATPHHVDMPAEGHRRTTIVLFQQPAVDWVVAPLDVCIGSDGPRYEPIRPYENQLTAKTVEPADPGAPGAARSVVRP